jgi:hypothetical protein
MRKMAGLIMLVLGVAAAPWPAAAQGNNVRILSVKPVGSAVLGKATEFVVEAEVELRSAAQAAVQVAFNDRSAGEFRTVDTRSVRDGVTRPTSRASAIPTDRGDRGAFSVRVNVGPWTSTGIWQPFATATAPIPLGD